MGTARRALTALVAVLAAVASTLAVAPRPAAAATERLCTGYESCAAQGYGHDGYASSSGTHWWRMVTGHNCTNYAAYRMVRRGLPNVRPWSGNGDAHSWGRAMSGITDQVPRVGSIAWWDAGAGGRGPLGHVAYVERVLSPDEVVVSEDVLDGDFHWTRLSRGSGWPSGFIHFADEPLRRLAAPRVTGRPRVGSTLRVTAGRWSAPVDASYQWLAGGRVVRGATRSTYVPSAGQVRDRIRVRVTVRNPGYDPVTTTTAATAPVRRGVIDVRRPLRVRGRVQVGHVVRVVPPRTSPRPGRVRVRWLVDGRVVRSGRSRTLRLGPPAARRGLRVEVTAYRSGYEPRTVRRRLGPVQPGEIVVTRPYTVSGSAEVGQELRLVPGRHTPAGARTGQLWFRDDEPIEGATGTTYVVQPADAGHRVAVVVGIAHRGYLNELVGVVAGQVPATVAPQGP
jgi:surface antigen